MNRELARTLVDKTGKYLGDNKLAIEVGYYKFGFKCKRYFIHRLVALAFGDKSINGMDVHHKDENKLNNHIDNLMILTRSEHIKLHRKGVQAYNKGVKLTEEKLLKRSYTILKDKLSIDDLDNIINSQLNTNKLFNIYDISYTTIKRIKNNPQYYINMFKECGE